jgi:hypothetical protein
MNYKYKVELMMNEKRDIITKMYASQEHFEKWELGLKKIESEYNDIFQEKSISYLIFENQGEEMKMKMTILKNKLPKQIDITYEVNGAYNLCKNFFYDKGDQTRWVMHVMFKFDKKVNIPIEKFVEKTKTGMQIFNEYVIEKHN